MNNSNIQQQQQQPNGYITSTVETENLKKFLASAPQLWTKSDDPPIRSYQLSNTSGDTISCIFWRGKFFITGTDIVKILLFRFSQAGRPVLNAKKFEEGIFSDLRNLKSGTEAILEEPKSEFLDFLFRHGCIRTQKKQKVFFWNCVPHESLFLDAIERDFKREGSLYHMNMMMNHTRYLQKQVAMMQATAIQQQYTGMAPPAPQMMPNSSSRSSSFSNPPPSSSLYPQPQPQPIQQFSPQSSQQYSSVQNGNDPFLNAPPLRLPNGKINVNAPILVAPAPTHTAHLLHQQQHPLFDFQTEFDPLNGGNDGILSEYLSNGGNDTAGGGFIDPSSIMNLHEY